MGYESKLYVVNKNNPKWNDENTRVIHYGY